jgi:hypothetical protein
VKTEKKMCAANLIPVQILRDQDDLTSFHQDETSGPQYRRTSRTLEMNTTISQLKTSSSSAISKFGFNQVSSAQIHNNNKYSESEQMGHY